MTDLIADPSAKRSGEDEIEASRAPLIEHLIELRSRLIKSLVAFIVLFFICFAGAQHIYNVLVMPMSGGRRRGHAKLIYTAPLEYLFTQIKIAAFGAGFFAFPVIATQIYKFVRPAFTGTSATRSGPICSPRRSSSCWARHGVLLRHAGADAVLDRDAAVRFGRAGRNRAAPKVSEYLALIMTLVFAFGISFQLPVVLTLLGRRASSIAGSQGKAALCHRLRLRGGCGAHPARCHQPAHARRPDDRPLRGLRPLCRLS